MVEESVTVGGKSYLRESLGEKVAALLEKKLGSVEKCLVKKLLFTNVLKLRCSNT